MDDKGNIYRESSRKSEDPVDRQQVELTPMEMRARTWRSSIAFTLLMLVVFGIATWFIYVEEKGEDVEGDEAMPFGEMALLPPKLPKGDMTPSILSPNASALSALDLETTNAVLESIDGQKMAQAMGQLRLASDYARDREWDSAERHARTALEIWPDMNAAYRTLGFIYTQRGQFEQAIAAFKKALEGNPFSAETYNNLGSTYMHNGLMDKAEELLFRSLDIRPDYYVANLNLGLLYLRQGRYTEAVDYFERGLERLHENVSARNNLAVALLRLGHYDEARDHLGQIINQTPDTAATYFNVAITYVLEKDIDEAMAWIEKGASRCSPVLCHKYLSDSDFSPLHANPQFQKFVSKLYPEMPAAPVGPSG